MEDDNVSDQRNMQNERLNVNVRKTQSAIARDARFRKLRRICKESQNRTQLPPDASGGDRGAGWKEADRDETDLRIDRSEFGEVYRDTKAYYLWP